MYGNGQNSPLGFLPSRHLNGSTWNGQFTTYPLPSGYASTLSYGDPVNLANTGKIQLAPVGGGTTPLLGVFCGVQYIDAQGNYQIGRSWTANTVTQGALDAVAFVIDDPSVLYDVQVSTAGGTPGPVAAPALTQADMGRNIGFNFAANTFNPINGVTPAPNPGVGSATGNSCYYLDYATVGSGATLSLKLYQFTPAIGNGPGIVFNNALVLINNDIYRGGGTGTAGTH